mmetsp:Transcript_33650/g.71811  ORF Transcript_33650/g.71811 Transcript_33650/m.71811 type:complete len:156 (-) Transcript_33650:379-846(-)
MASLLRPTVASLLRPACLPGVARLSTRKPGRPLVDCSKVEVHADEYGGAGAFAACDIRQGQEVERGIVRVLTNVDGNENPYVFTWSDEIPNVTWATGSGASTFYNTGTDEESNTHMERDFRANTFVITATRDIYMGEELLHVYKSKAWRTCFKPL